MRRAFWSILVLLLVAATSAFAAENTPSELFAAGKQEFEAGQFAKAYDSFQQAFLQDPGNLDYSFFMGRAAFEEGDYEAAIMAYDRILIAEPDSPRVKLELARCHLRLGSRELAKQYFKEVLATNPPEAVWQNIQKFLAAIAASERRNFFSGIFSVGVQHDDNVGFAPSSSTVVLPILNLPISMAPEKSDWIYNSTAVLNYVYKFLDTPWSWKTSFTNYNAFYDTQSDLDLNYYALNTGPVRQTDKYLWEIQALVDYIDLDYDRYLGAYGLASTLTVPFDERIFFVIGAALQDRNYYQDGGKDSTNLRIYGGPVFTVCQNRLGLTFARETESADNDLNSYNRFTMQLRYDRLLPFDFACFALLRFENTDYDKKDPWFLVKRSDELQEYALGLSRTVWRSEDKKRSLAAQLSYSHTETDSNIAIYAYDKNVVGTTLTLAF